MRKAEIAYVRSRVENLSANQSHELTYDSSRDLAFVVTSSENRPAVERRQAADHTIPTGTAR